MNTMIALFSVDDYHRMIETGILARRRVELIDGAILEMPPEGSEHAYLGETLGILLGGLMEGRARVREGKPITLDTSEPQPDIALVRLPRLRYRERHPYPEDIYLVVEVSRTTLAFDTTEKKLLYARAGIIEYWAVDVKGRRLIVYRSPLNGDYSISFSVGSGETISPLAFPDVTIEVDQIFAN
jgi:Uma2 family endonuclease